jgi:hypothetical protein
VEYSNPFSLEVSPQLILRLPPLTGTYQMAERCDGSSFVMSALPNRQRAVASCSIAYIMQNLLQQLDFDYYRSALLLSARAELERSRQERPASNGGERRRKSPLGAAASADGRPRQKCHVQVSLTGARGKVRCE